MDSLFEIEGLIANAEKKGQKESLKKQAAYLSGQLREAQAELTKSETAFSETRLRYGDPDAVRIDKLGKIQELREKVKHYGDHLDDRVDVEAKLNKAEEEVEALWKTGSTAIEKLSKSIQEARARVDSIIAKCDELRLRAGVERLEDIEELSDLPELPSTLIFNLSQELSQTMIDIVTWSSAERAAMLKIISGQARVVQERALSEAEKRQLGGIFSELNDLSAQYKPGYLAPMNRNEYLDWKKYVKDAQEEFAEAARAREARVRADEERRRLAAEELSRKEDAKRRGVAMLSVLRELVDAGTEKNAASIQETVKGLLEEVGLDADNEELLDILDGQDELFEGSSFRSLRKYLGRLNCGTTAAEFAKHFPKAVKVTKGSKAIMIGGTPRAERMEKLQELFGFADLQWVSSERKEPRSLEALAQKARNGSIQFVIELAGFAGHHVENILSKACDGSACRFIRVPRGYGANNIATIIEQGL